MIFQLKPFQTGLLIFLGCYMIDAEVCFDFINTKKPSFSRGGGDTK
jgi:hypothetical protein